MNWEPWTGCRPYSTGCENCYYYGAHGKRCGQNIVARTDGFSKPTEKDAKGEYRVRSGRTLPTCFTTDFFIDQADLWRAEAWGLIRQRPDVTFLILTKRIDRVGDHLPPDWGEGYPNVYLGCTVETQEIADYRLPIFLDLPLKRRFIAAAPLLTSMDLTPYLIGGKVEQLTVSGETGRDARPCDPVWIESLRGQAATAGIKFWLKSRGHNQKNVGQLAMFHEDLLYYEGL